MTITKATVPSETSFVCNTKLFLEGSNNADLAKTLIRGARQLARGMSGIDGIESIRQYLNNCDIEALITRIEESKNSLLRFDDSFAGEYFELLKQRIDKLDKDSSDEQYLTEYGIYEKDYWNTLVAMLEKNEDNLNETLKEQLAIARAMAGYYNTSDEMGSRNTDSEKMVDLLEERKKCEAELLKLNKGLTEEDLAKALDSLEERYAVTILGVKYNSVQEKMSELNIDDEDYEDKCIDLLKEGTRYQKELLGLSKYLTKEEIKEQSALLDEECEKNVILVKNSIAGNQLSKLDITDEDYTIKCITLLAKQKEYAKEILKLDKSLTSEQLDEKINALESQYQYSCLLAENGKLQSDIDNLNIEAEDYEEKRLELLTGQRNCIEQMLKMNNNLTEEQISEQLTLLDQEIHSAKQNVEWAQTNAFEKFDQYTTAFVASAFCGVIDVGENIFDGLAMLAGKLSNDEETAAELVKTDFSEKVYAAWMSGGAGINDNAAYSKVHDVGNFVGNIGGYVLLSLVPGGAAVTSTLGFLAAEGSASERALNSGATFDQAFWVGAGSGVMGGIAGGWTSQFKTGLQDKIYSTIWEVVSDAAKGGAIGTVEPMVNAALEYSVYAKDLKDENDNLLYKNDLDYYLKSGTLVNVATGFASGFIGTGVSGAKKYYQYNREVNLLAKAMEAEEVIKRRLDDIPQMTAAQEARVKEIFDIEQRVASDKQMYYDNFKTYREHAELHTRAVAEYAVGLGLNVGSIDDKALAELYYASYFHDLGMAGGGKNSTGNYYGLNYKKKSTQFLGLINDITCDESNSDTTWSYEAGQATRDNHPLNSAIFIMTEDIVPEGLDREKIALLALSHSKSTSGITSFADIVQWKKAIDKLDDAVDNYNRINGLEGTDAIAFDSTRLRSILDDDFEFKRLTDQALCIRDGDAMSKLALTEDGHTIMQTGTVAHVSSPQYSTSDTIPKEDDIVDIIKNKNGEVIERVDDKYGKLFHAGEENVIFKSSYDGKNYYAEAGFIDPRKVPNSSNYVIFERIGEVATYTNCDNRTFVINIPEYLRGTNYGESYAKLISDSISENVADALAKFQAGKISLESFNSIKNFYTNCIKIPGFNLEIG